MNSETRLAVEAALGSHIVAARALSGGDINDAFAARLATGATVFIKTNDRADPAMFPAEARGLAFLEEAAALRVPHVLTVSSGNVGEPCFLVLEYLEPARPVSGFDERLGRGLATLHRAGAPHFGLDHRNFIGRLAQTNEPAGTWHEFYGQRRLLPQLRLAVDSGRATKKMKEGLERLVRRLADLVGAPESPSRLHGDLWGGNLHVDDHGEPCLIDPAVYGGHREVDLAMMRLFGGFSERCFSAYAEAWPLSPGHQDRIPLYQLYPLLVHVNLFGGSYVRSVERALDRCA